MLQRQAAEVFNDVDKYIKYSIREDEGTLEAAISADELSAELSKLKQETVVTFESIVGKQHKELPFSRQPTQEQDVIALFCMVLARGGLPYEMLRISSNYRYDCFLQFTSEKPKKKISIVAEFKFLGESILSDLGDAKARYGQLNLLICWEMNEKKLKAAGFIVDTIDHPKNELPGATHKLSFPSSAGVKDQPIAVICLRRIVDRN